MPGAIVVSLVAPDILSAGVPGLVAATATLVSAVAIRNNIIVPMGVGVLVDLGLRTVLR